VREGEIGEGLLEKGRWVNREMAMGERQMGEQAGGGREEGETGIGDRAERAGKGREAKGEI
jgi:hypothetical protein